MAIEVRQPTTVDPTFDTVHAPLTHWAARVPHRIAIDDGSLRMSFDDLARMAEGHEGLPLELGAPRPIWTTESSSPGAQLVEFLRIVGSGNAAAIGDPGWSQLQRQQVLRLIGMVHAQGLPSGAMLPAGSFYVGFTSGSTGLPKGFVRSHKSWLDSFSACLQAFGLASTQTVLAPGRLSHSLPLFGALLGLWSGGGVRLQSQFSASASLQTLASGDARALVATPSQLILMLEQSRRHGPRVIHETQLVMIGGARWPRGLTADLQALFPKARIVEFYGASETSFVAWVESHPDLAAAAVGRPFPGVELRIAPLEPAPEDSKAPVGRHGLIYVRSPMIFTGYVTPEPTFGPGALLRDGDWLSVGDLGWMDADGLLHLIGRQQRMFVVQGKNLFPEEVEQVLSSHPSIAGVSVQAVPDSTRGHRAIAVLELLHPIDRSTLLNWCRSRLDAYKAPRTFFACDRLPSTTSAKVDHAAIARLLASNPEGDSNWRTLPWVLNPQ